MSKKNKTHDEVIAEQENQVQAEEVAEVVEEPKEVKAEEPKVEVERPNTDDLKRALEHMSLRQLSILTESTYNVLLKAAKAPISGVAYDPEALNLHSVQSALIRKLTMDGYKAINWDELIEKASTMSSSRMTTKVDMSDFEVGNAVKLRDIKNEDGSITESEVYTVEIMTGTHLVIVPMDPENTVPRVMSYDTFLHQGGRRIKIGADAQ